MAKAVIFGPWRYEISPAITFKSSFLENDVTWCLWETEEASIFVTKTLLRTRMAANRYWFSPVIVIIICSTWYNGTQTGACFRFKIIIMWRLTNAATIHFIWGMKARTVSLSISFTIDKISHTIAFTRDTSFDCTITFLWALCAGCKWSHSPIIYGINLIQARTDILILLREVVWRQAVAFVVDFCCVLKTPCSTWGDFP